MKKMIALALLTSVIFSACSNAAPPASSAGASSAAEQVKISFSAWGSASELERFEELAQMFNSQNPDIEMTFIPVPSDYDQKILTQLSGGTAPDVFNVGDGVMSKFMETGCIANLTPWLEREDSIIKADDFIETLYGPAKVGDEIYGLLVDCNPAIIWYNKTVLRDAGVTEMPCDVYEAGNWNWDTFTAMMEQVKASGKHGFILDRQWYRYYSWLTSNGGTIYDADGKFVGHTDEKSRAAYQFLYDNMQNGNMTYAGTLPQGQGGDAMFLSNQVAFVSAGRQWLPVFKGNDQLDYDIVPYPTNTGNKQEPTGVAAAYIVMNNDTPHPEAAYKFISFYESKEGAIFRLQEGGNAVPPMLGVDELVLNDPKPEHAQYFLDARNVGYGYPAAEAAVPGLRNDIMDYLDAVWLTDIPFEQAMNELGDLINTKIEDHKAAE